MTAVLLTLIGVLTLLVVGTAAVALRLAARVSRLEEAAASSSPTAVPRADTAPEPVGYVITQLGEPAAPHVDEVDDEVEAVPTVAPGLFADLVLREGVVQAASLVHGVRRALSPENRNRIRFEMRREVKRSRKQRRADLRDARREWEARQRAHLDDLEGTAA